MPNDAAARRQKPHGPLLDSLGIMPHRATTLVAALGGKHLAEEIGGLIGLPLNVVSHKDSVDGELKLGGLPMVRGRDVFVVQCLGGTDERGKPALNDRFFELAFIISALRRSSALRITAIVPYYAYGRQTCKLTSRVPVSAADVAAMLEEVQVSVDQIGDRHRRRQQAADCGILLAVVCCDG